MMRASSAGIEGVLMPKKTSKKAAPRAKVASNGSARKITAGKATASKATATKATASKATASKATASRAAPARSPKKKAAARRASAPARKSNKVQPIPEMYGPVTAQLVVSPCAEALDFYRRAFGAKTLMTMPGPDGLLVHAEMNLGGSIIMLADEVNMPGSAVRRSPKNAGAVTGGVMLYVKDVDAAFQRAVDAGAKAAMPPQDQFWGDRLGQVEDPYGHVWSMATHVRDVTPEEMQAAMSQMTPGESGANA
jgi:PhnB protein